MMRRPPRPARLVALAVAAALAAVALVATTAAAADDSSGSRSDAPVTIFSLKPDYMRVLKRRTTVYMPGERGGEGKWARQFPGGEGERKEAEQAAKKVLELLAVDAALWAGIPVPVTVTPAPAPAAAPAPAPAAAAAPKAAGNATAPAAPAPKARRSLLRKLMADAPEGASANSGNKAGDPAFSSFLEKIGAVDAAKKDAPAPAAAAAANAAKPAAAANAAKPTAAAAAPATPAANAAKPAATNAAKPAAANAAKPAAAPATPAANAAKPAAVANAAKPAATNAAAKPAAEAPKPAATNAPAKPAVNVVPANPNTEPAIDPAAAEKDTASAQAAAAQAAAEADAVEAAATQAVKDEADKAAADKAAANKAKPAAAEAPKKAEEQKKPENTKPEEQKKKNAAAPAPAAPAPVPAAAETEEEDLAPKIGGLYTGPNILGGYAIAQSWAALDAYEAANAKAALGTSDPPSPAIAVGHGQVLEAAGWSLRAYSALDGTPITAPMSLAALFDVAQPVANASAGGDLAKTASLIGRASAHFDAHGTGRFFVAAHVQDVGATPEPKSRIVIAVSAGPNIVGSWYIYDLDVGFAGKNGLPTRDACMGGAAAKEAGRVPGGAKGPVKAQCWAAEPALGNDGQALYLTFDNYRRDPESGYTHIGANVVALDKFAMASSVRDVAAAEWWLDSNPADDQRPALGIAPALPAPFVYTKGTAAQFLSAPYSAATGGQALRYLVHYGLVGTKDVRGAASGGKKTLRALSSALRLEVRRLPVTAPAPLAAGGNPVSQPNQGAPALLLSTTNGVTAAALEPADFPLGRTLGAGSPAQLSLPSAARLGNLRLTRDRLYTVAPVRESSGRVAAWWLEIDQPSVTARRSGVVSYEKGSLLGPTIAVNKAGRAAVAATAVGSEVFPSAAVATLEFGEEDDDGLPTDAWASARLAAPDANSLPTVPYTLRLPGAGAGFADGKGVYPSSAGPAAKALRARSGGAAAGASSSAVGVDGTLWSAAEVVAQSCTVAEYRSDATCGATRTADYNWASRITQIESDSTDV